MSRKKVYRPTSWAQYNKSLCNKGSLTLWISEELINTWLNHEKTGQKGASNYYSDTAILCANQLRVVYNLTYRATQGFISSLFKLLNISLKVPHYSVIQRRFKDLGISIPTSCNKKINTIALDSTGLKVYGEGEWKVRQHGYAKRRTWRKIHLGFNVETQEVICAAVTTNDFKDSDVLEDCLSQVDGVKQICLDGAYDEAKCYDICIDKKIKPLIPPRKRAKLWKKRDLKNPHPRDTNLRHIRKHGKKHWKLNSGYSIRSLSETGMYRFKQAFTDKLRSRTFDLQANEVFLKCGILNKFAQLGLANSKAS